MSEGDWERPNKIKIKVTKIILEKVKKMHRGIVVWKTKH